MDVSLGVGGNLMSGVIIRMRYGLCRECGGSHRLTYPTVAAIHTCSGWKVMSITYYTTGEGVFFLIARYFFLLDATPVLRLGPRHAQIPTSAPSTFAMLIPVRGDTAHNYLAVLNGQRLFFLTHGSVIQPPYESATSTRYVDMLCWKYQHF
jgi:hypothetical protein